MKIVGWTLSNEYHEELPDEDNYSWKQSKNGIFACVADGITRDPINYPKNLSFLPRHDSPEFKDFLNQYPKPSPAQIASKIFVDNSLKFLKSHRFNSINIFKAADKANREIKKWNDKNMKNPNHLERDLAGCVAILVGINGREINLLYNADCGLAIFGKDKKQKFITVDLMKEKESFMLKKGKINWINPLERKRIRSMFRNKIRFFKNQCVSIGAFTGEKQALSKYLLAENSLIFEKGSTIVLFSDGARNYFDDKISKGNATRVLKKKGIAGLEGYLASGKYDKRERTVVAITP